MTTFFGVAARNDREFFEHDMIALDKTRESEARLLNTFRGIQAEDVIFLKDFTPQSGLKVKAVGISLSSFASEDDLEIRFPVEWIWMGEKFIDQANEELALCGDALYEEHNILVQREILDMLPSKFQIPLPL